VGETRKSNDVSLDTLTALLDGLFARVPEAIVWLDTGDRILQVNPEFTRFFGYAHEEACGHLIQELIVPEEFLTEVEEYARRAVRGESLNYEAVRKRKDGTRVHVSVITGPVSVADGHISHFVIYRDITERKRAEQELRKSEEDFRTITDTIRQPIGVETPDGTMLYANRVALDNSGLTLDEVIKEGSIRRGNGFLARRCHPDDINRVRDERRIGLLEGVRSGDAPFA
jgi:PAS domain S-box-containing protein